MGTYGRDAPQADSPQRSRLRLAGWINRGNLGIIHECGSPDYQSVLPESNTHSVRRCIYLKTGMPPFITKSLALVIPFDTVNAADAELFVAD